MSDSKTLATSLVDLYGLAEPLSAQESGVLAGQLARLAVLLETRFAPAGALFGVEPSAYWDALERLADEPGP